MPDKCPVCNSDVNKPQESRTHDMLLYSCLRCGDYWVEGLLPSTLPSLLKNDTQKIAVLSHWIRTQHETVIKESAKDQAHRKLIILDEELVNRILSQEPPNPAEQADNIVRWLGSKPRGELIAVQPQNLLSIIGSATSEELRFVIDYLISAGLVHGHTHAVGGLTGSITLSFEGWQYYEELKRGAVDSRKAFMAMPYGVAELDKIVKETFKPAVEKTGFDLSPLIDRPQPAGLIDDRLRVEIQTSRFLIADLTHENAGAYWEAGYAEGLGKPVIYTCAKNKFDKEPPHFDTNHHLTIIWQAEKPQEAAEELKATIRATLPGEAKLTDE